MPELPSIQTWPFATDLTVQIGDINYGNHLGNDAVLRLFQEARLRFLKTGQFSEIQFGDAGLIMTDAYVRYRRQASYGDALTIFVGADSIRRSSFRLLYKIERKTDNALIAEGFTSMACFNYASNKPARMSTEAGIFLKEHPAC